MSTAAAPDARPEPATRNALGSLRRIAPDAGAVALIVVPPWPGVFTIDSQAMYRMANAGNVDDWYSPILVSMWRVALAVGLPSSAVFVTATAVVVVGLLTLYRLALPRWWALVATAATVLFPPVYGLLGWVGRDVWFLGLLLVVAASLGWATVLPARRFPLVTLAFTAAWLAADARQNGFPALAVVGGAAAWFVFSGRRHRWWLVIGASLLTILLGVAAQRAARIVAVQKDVSPEQVLYFQDLLAVSLRLEESQVPRELLPRDQLDEVRTLWVPAQVGAVLFRDDPPVDYRPRQGSARRTRMLRDAWLDMVTTHPFAYAVERADLYRRLLGIGDTVPGAWYATTDVIPGTAAAGLRQRFDALNDARGDYLRLFEQGAPGTGGPLHQVWIYLALGLVSAAAIVAAGPRLRAFGWTMLALQLLMQLVLVFAATLLEYRFELFQVVLGLALTAIAARLWWEAHLLRLAGGPSAAARHPPLLTSARPSEELEPEPPR